MSDEELNPTQTPTEHDTQPLAVNPASAVASFMEWLQTREERTGPFSVNYAVAAGNALVDKFCVAQGWIAVALDDEQVEQVKALREKYPD